jgi:RHS repeat-associated protein
MINKFKKYHLFLIFIIIINGICTVSNARTTAIPIINSFSPACASTGSVVTITGTSFTTATNVKFNGINATSFTVVNSTQITAVVPSTATTGVIGVTNASGTGHSATSLSIVNSTISSFSPSSGISGTSVVLTGTNFTGITAVKFNGVAATTYTVNSTTQITATVPATATSGTISIITSCGTFTSATSFTVLSVTSFAPTCGVVGTSVVITGSGFTGVTGVKFNGVTATTYTVNSTTQITATVPVGASSGLISVVTAAGTATSATSFSVLGITSFAPSLAIVGGSVVLTGTNFTGATAVKFNGVAATSYTVNSATQITVTVPATATSGTISVTSSCGTVTSATAFTVVSINSFAPTCGVVGTSVVITGTGFTGATAVKFNGVAATSYTVNSATQITATVPAGATTGLISIVISGATFTSATSFSVLGITSFAPSSAFVGGSVVLTGTNFTGITAVKFNGVAATTYTVNSATQITVTVPATATSGTISITSSCGTATSANAFTILAGSITSFSPTCGMPEFSVVITGTGFTGVTAVKFNGIPAYYSVISATEIRADVPEVGATTGPITVITTAGTAISASAFSVFGLTSFAPSSAIVGDNVVLTGTGFTGTTAVKFNGVTASYIVNSATQITATVPATATSGTISVTSPCGMAISDNIFTVIVPSITSFTPTCGLPGTLVTLNGTLLGGATDVQFNGVSAAYTYIPKYSQITVTVPPGATSGLITVVTPTGNAISTSSFSVLGTIASFAPLSAGVGGSVVLTGANFTGTTAVKFNGVNASYTVNSATQITTTVPTTASTGTISITSACGTTTSPTAFTVTAGSVTSFAPACGVSGTSVVITGSGFTGVTDVKFNNVSTTYMVNSVTQITAVVPVGTTSGFVNITTSGGNAISSFAFVVSGITSFAPMWSRVGDNVVLNGDGFTGATSVSFNGTAASSFSVLSSTQILAIVPTGATSGTITVTTPCGNSSINGFSINQGCSAIDFDYTSTSGSAGTGRGQYNSPSAIGFSPTNGMYVVDAQNNRVQAGLFSWGTLGSGNGQFNNPMGIAFAADGRIYVADCNNNRIQIFDQSGGYLGQWGTLGSGNGQFNNPMGMAVDILGNVYVCDKNNNRIQKFDSNGNYLDQFGGAGSGNGQFNSPVGVAVDNAGNIFITDKDNHRIQKFNSSRIYVGQWGATQPWGITIDASNNIYITDMSDKLVIKFDNNGVLLLQFGGSVTEGGFFTAPAGIALDQSCNAYVVDNNNHVYLYSALTPPHITSFTPSCGPIGTTVIITGTNFNGATNVKFNGAYNGTFVVNSSTQITATVPANATTGTISITGIGGSMVGTSTAVFTVSKINSLTPSCGMQGTTVVINGSNLTDATAVSFNGVPAVFTVNSSTQITTTIPAGATSGKITIAHPCGTILSYSDYPVSTISSLSSFCGVAGSTVLLTGSNFIGASIVKISGVPVTSFTIVNDTKISVVVPGNTGSGPFTVTTSCGEVSSSVYLITNISSIASSWGTAGSTVVISGGNFTGASAVKFDGITSTFNVDNDNQITATIPVAATNGNISITTFCGTAYFTADWNRNWVHSRSYAEDGTLISEERKYLDNFGNILQSQSLNIEENLIFANATIYDRYNKPVLNTLSAPIPENLFTYHSDFIKASGSNVPYNYNDFDLPVTMGNSLGEINNPKPVDSISSLLGKYYSDNNSIESNVPNSIYPYSRVNYNTSIASGISSVAGAGNEYSMGHGHEQKKVVLPVCSNELTHYTTLKSSYFSGGFPLAEIENVVKVISKNEDGKESVAYLDNRNNLLAKASVGGTDFITTTTSLNSKFYYYDFYANSNYSFSQILIECAQDIEIAYFTTETSWTVTYTGPASGNPYHSFIAVDPGEGTPVTHHIQIRSISPFRLSYIVTTNPFHNSQMTPSIVSNRIVEPLNYGSNASSTDIHVQNFSDVLLTAPAWATMSIMDLTDGRLVYDNGPVTSSFPISSNGYYRIKMAGKPPVKNYGYAPECLVITNKQYYKDFSYCFYDDAGRSIASVAPKGVDKTKNTMPVFVTTYKYSSLNKLIQETDPDKGLKDFVYRNDGLLKFTRDAQQKAAPVQTFSYINYDKYGRTLENGEYRGNGTCTIVFEAPIDGSSLANGTNGLLNSVTADGNLGTCRFETTKFFYDVPDGTSPNSKNQNYTHGSVLTKTVNDNSTTWMSYDNKGRIEWTQQKITGLVTNGTDVKTCDYVYNIKNRLTNVIYQASIPTERFEHRYTYNNNNQLAKVESLKGAAIIYQLEAKYFYYKHGPIKRIELADQLQGIDYIYTLQGKLKSINHPSLDESKDPGRDGYLSGTNAGFAKDAFGMILQYHANDYSKAGAHIQNTTISGIQDFYSGNINAIRWKTRGQGMGVGSVEELVYAYSYDNNYQLTQANFGTVNPSSENIFITNTTNRYNISAINYDANGNLTNLIKNNSSGTVKDNFVYENGGLTGTGGYTNPQNNRLVGVQLGSTGSYHGVYEYDNIGRMIKQTDVNADEKRVEYNSTGLVSRVSDKNNNTLATFMYDERGFRINKVTYSSGIISYTSWYVNDYSGNILSVYDDKEVQNTYKQTEIPINGRSKLGSVIINGSQVDYVYSISDHLGNVRATIGRLKVGGEAVILTWTDYYPFGDVMDDRHNPIASSFVSDRYGYQGCFSEKDAETGWNSFELRMYDAQIGKFLSGDPFSQFNSAYLAMGNNPINSVDPNGGSAVGDFIDKNINKNVWQYVLFGDITLLNTIPKRTQNYLNEHQDTFEKIGVAALGVVLTVATDGLDSPLIPLMIGAIEGGAGEYVNEQIEHKKHEEYKIDGWKVYEKAILGAIMGYATDGIEEGLDEVLKKSIKEIVLRKALVSSTALGTANFIDGFGGALLEGDHKFSYALTAGLIEGATGMAIGLVTGTLEGLGESYVERAKDIRSKYAAATKLGPSAHIDCPHFAIWVARNGQYILKLNKDHLTAIHETSLDLSIDSTVEDMLDRFIEKNNWIDFEKPEKPE